MSVREAVFEEKVIESARRQYGWSFKVRGSSIQRRGMTDVVIILPTLQTEEVPSKEIVGGTIFLELKSATGRVGKHQTKVMEEIQASGGLALISKIRKDDFVETWEVGKKLDRTWTSFFHSKHFTEGWWLRDVLETKSRKRFYKTIPTSFLATKPGTDT